MLNLFFFAIILVVIVIPLSIPIGITILVVKAVKKKKAEKLQNDDFFSIGDGNSEKKKIRVKPEREKLSSSTVMLLIGTAFIVLSGIAFGVANWVKTSPEGRTGIILIASAISFGISLFFNKAVKLKATSTAFYTVGTVFTSVSVIIAGFYNLLGEWLSVGGEGSAILFALASIITAVLSLTAYRIYETKAFSYIGVSAGFLVIPCLISQFTDSFRMSAVVSIAVQAVITASIYIFGIHENKPLEKQIKVVGSAGSFLLALESFSYAFGNTFDPDIYTLSITAIIIAQLIGYGIHFNVKALLGLNSIVSTYALFAVSCITENNYTESFAMIVFGILSLMLYLATRFIPQIKTSFSEIFTLCVAVTGAFISAEAGNDVSLFIRLIPITAMSALIFCYVFSKKKSTQAFSGFIAPVLPFFTASYVNDFVAKKTDINTDVITFSVLSLVYIAVSIALVYLPKYAFSFHAKYQRKSDMIIYSNIYTSGIVLLCMSGSHDYIFIPMLICLLHFFVSCRLKNNISSVLPLCSLIIMTETFTKDVSENNSNTILIVSFILFAVFMTVSAIFFRESVVTNKEEKLILDTPLISGVILLIFIFENSVNGIFFPFIAIAVYIACFIKRNTQPDTASLILSVSTAMTTIAFMARPSFMTSNEMISDKVTLAIIALAGTAYKFIWKNHESFSKKSSTFIYIISFIGLISDAVKFHSSGNTIFILSVTTAILIISFTVKSKTWFTASSIALAFITVYSTRKYLTAMNWWAYLFIVGMILIGISALNEYCKSKGKSIKEIVSLKFMDWTW